jgi:drug/metabolite transporter (DMT)-like permease
MIRLLALVGIVGISFSAIFVRLADVSPATAAFFRAAYALPVLLVVVPKLAPAKPWRRGRLLALASGLIFAVNLVLWHHTIGLIGAGLSTVLGNTQVVFIGMLGWLVYRERPTRLAMLTIPVMLGGIVLISGLGRTDAYGSDPVAGVIFGILTAVTSAAYVMLLRAASRSGGEPALAVRDTTAAAVFGTLLVGLAVDPQFDLVPHWPAHGWLVALALVSQVLGWLLISRALAALPALETAVLLLVQPLLTVLWGLWLFAEVLSWLQWLGVGAVLGGLALLSLYGSTVPDAASVAPPREAAHRT